ncbi:hypothetical protein [Lentzea xinjiangensis]|uniref:hypothetical protein n=1 Tax=Lentzea xinjiangensis TaxID=402600 RepID=UPI001160C1E3|nr:hypothetical protein [Lentzea xinjiangensis]
MHKRAEVLTYTNGGGLPHDAGHVVGYYACPTFVIERDDGTRFSWAADLTFEHPTCREIEGSTGIACGLDRHHALPHIGTTTPAQAEAGGHSMTVTWPTPERTP